jgi:hypothetical protein
MARKALALIAVLSFMATLGGTANADPASRVFSSSRAKAKVLSAPAVQRRRNAQSFEWRYQGASKPLMTKLPHR